MNKYIRTDTVEAFQYDGTNKELVLEVSNGGEIDKNNYVFSDREEVFRDPTSFYMGYYRDNDRSIATAIVQKGDYIFKLYGCIEVVRGDFFEKHFKKCE